MGSKQLNVIAQIYIEVCAEVFGLLNQILNILSWNTLIEIFYRTSGFGEIAIIGKIVKKSRQNCIWSFTKNFFLFEGKIRDNKAHGVFEPAISKVKCLKFATEAAITILRIDDMIKLAPEQKEGRDNHGH